MGKEQSISNRETVGSPSRGATHNVAALVILFNVVTGGLGGLYVSTQSIAVTALAAGLVALLGLYAVVSGRHRR